MESENMMLRERLLNDELKHPEYFPIGSDAPLLSSSRIIVATNRNLEEATKIGEFRLDLYYRLHTYRIQLPSLRERPDDLKLLLEYFRRRIPRFSDDTQALPVNQSSEVLSLTGDYLPTIEEAEYFLVREAMKKMGTK